MRDMVKMAEDLSEAQAKIAAYERREKAEDFLVEIMEDPRTPSHFRPTTALEFLSKRAQIEGLDDIKAARSAVKMAQLGSFEIGDVNEEGASDQVHSGSRADNEFSDWLVSRGTEF
jgi:hypothetical protein